MSAAVPPAVSSLGRMSVVVCVAAAPSAVPITTSREGESAKATAADAVSLVASSAAVAVASSATRRRMYERKEDMCPAVEGAVVTGTGSVSTSMSTSAVEAAVAVVPVAVATVVLREEEAARTTAADAAGVVVSSAASEGILGKRGAELPPVLASR